MAAFTAPAPVFLRPPRRFSACSWKQRQSHFCYVQVRTNSGASLFTAGRAPASSQDKTVSTRSSQEEEDDTGEIQGTGASADVESQDKGQEIQEEKQQKEIGEALRELRGKEKDVSSSSGSFWSGLLEEIGLIEWPDFGRVFGTTLVVLAIILGSSVVLLTVNFLLAELSNIVFKVQSQ